MPSSCTSSSSTGSKARSERLRLRGWSQRNPALAVGAVLGTLLVIGLPTALYVQEQRSNQRLTLTNAELDATNARLGASLDREASERQRAEANLSRALDSVNTMLTSVADRLRNVPGMESVRRELVDKALRVTHELEQQAELAGPHRRQLAELYLTRATLLGVLGETEEGLDSMRVALEQFEAARAELPGDLATLSSYANALYRLSPILTNLGQHEEALAALTQAAQLYAEADALEASGSTARMGLLSTLRLSAEAAARLGDRGGAIALLEDLLGATDALADGEASFDERLLLVDLNEALGMQYVMAGRRSAARAPYSAAWKQLQLCTAENATSVEARKATVALAHRFGPLLCDLGALEAGEDVLRRGLALARETLQQFPGEWYNDYEVAELLRALGAALSERQAWEAVEACFGESYERFAGLTQRLPLIAGLRSKLGYLLSDWASAYRDQGRLDEALDAADRAIEEHRAVIGLATAAEGTGMRALLGQALVRRGAILADLDEPSAAAEAIAEALTHSPEDPFAFRQSAKVLARCLAAAADGERAHFVDAAFAAIERALELGLEHPADLIEDERLQPLHADPRFAELRARVALD